MVTVSDFISIINQVLPQPHAGLVDGIVFGAKASINRELYEALQITGTLHIASLSGMNITILIGVVSFTLLRWISRRMASLLTILIIIGFVWFVGSSPSIIRAAIMGSISILAIVFGRQSWSLLSLLLSAILMIAVKPEWFRDLSFQLSALATLGVILFGPGKSGSSALASQENLLRSYGTKIPYHSLFWYEKVFFIAKYVCKNLFYEDLRITLAAQVFTIPLTLYSFHRLSLVAPLSNMLIGWTIAPITVLGMIAALAGYIWLPLGQAVAWVTWVFTQYLLTAIFLTAKIPYASIGL